jgi:hypothetical protein
MAEENMFRRSGFACVALALAACTAGATTHGSPVGTAAAPSMRASQHPTTGSQRPAADEAVWESRGSLVGVGDGLAFVSGRGSLHAMKVACTKGCEPVFTADVTTSWPVLVHGRVVYVGTGRNVAVLPTTCRGTCEPLASLRSPIPGRPGTGASTSEPPNSYRPVAVEADEVVVQYGWDGAAGTGVFPSVLAGFPRNCRGVCEPDWTTSIGSGRQPPAVAGSHLLAPRIGALDAFECSSATNRCDPAWTATLYEHPGYTSTTTPMVIGGTVLVSTQGCVCGAEGPAPVLTAYDMGCSERVACDPHWRWSFDGTRFLSGVGADADIAYVATQAGGSRRRSQGLGFSIGCVGSCAPVVHLALGKGSSWGEPLVSGGTVFVPRRTPGGVLAFDANCRGVCRPSAIAAVRRPVNDVVTIGRKLLVSSGPDLYLFGPPTAHWKPRWHWRGSGTFDELTVAGNVALIASHQRVRAVRLPIGA